MFAHEDISNILQPIQQPELAMFSALVVALETAEDKERSAFWVGLLLGTFCGVTSTSIFFWIF